MPRQYSNIKNILIFSLITIILISAISSIWKTGALSGYATWWDANWIHRKEINITESAGIGRANQLVDMNIGFDSGLVSNCTKEIRVVKSNNFTRTYSGVLLTEDFNTPINLTKWANVTIVDGTVNQQNNQLFATVYPPTGGTLNVARFHSTQTFNTDADIVGDFNYMGDSESTSTLYFGFNLSNRTLATGEFFGVSNYGIINNLSVVYENKTFRGNISSNARNETNTIGIRHFLSQNRVDVIYNKNVSGTVNLTKDGFTTNITNYNASIFLSPGFDTTIDMRVDNIRVYPEPTRNAVKIQVNKNGTAQNNVNVSIHYLNGTLVVSNNTSSDGIASMNLTNMVVFPVSAGIVLRDTTGTIVGSEAVDSVGVDGLYPNDTWAFDTDQPTEIFSQVYNETYSGSSCTSANVVFETNVSANSNTTYSLFYKYSSASAPSYGFFFNNTTNPDNNFAYGNFTRGASMRIFLNDTSKKDNFIRMDFVGITGTSNLSIINNGPVRGLLRVQGNTSYGRIDSNVSVNKNRNVEINSIYTYTANSGAGAGIDNNVLFGLWASVDNTLNKSLSFGNVSGKTNTEASYGENTRYAFHTAPDPPWIGIKVLGVYGGAFGILPSFNSLLYGHNLNDPDRISLTETTNALSGITRSLNYTVVARDLQIGDFSYWQNYTENPLNISFLSQQNGPNYRAPTTTSTTVAAGGTCSCLSAKDWSLCKDGKQERINYKCGAQTSYICQSYSETRICASSCMQNISTASVDLSIPYAQPKQKLVCNITDARVPASRLEFSPTVDISNSKIFVKPIEGNEYTKTTGNEATAQKIPDAGGNVYRYFEIYGENFTSKDAGAITLKFFVENSWIKNNTISAEFVKIKILSGSSWKDIPTKKVGEDKEKTYYEASVEELALFSIVAPSASEWSTCKNGIQERLKYVCKETGCAYEKETKPCEQCSTACAQPSEYSLCSANKQTRKNFVCNSDTNFSCKEVKETRACECGPEVERALSDAEIALRNSRALCEDLSIAESLIETAKKTDTCALRGDLARKTLDAIKNCKKREIAPSSPLVLVLILVFISAAIISLLHKRFTKSTSLLPQH